MGRDTSNPGQRSKPARTNRGLREAGVVLGLIALALAAVWLAIDASIREEGTAGPRETPSAAAAGLPPRIPYEDLVKGHIERGESGVVTLSYDFDPVAKEEGRVFTENDLIPQLEDWNLRLPGSRDRTSIIRGEWRVRGEGRTRVSFSVPVQVSVTLELVSGWAAVQMATNRIGEGYECRIGADRHAEIRVNPERSRPAPGEEPATPEPVVLARSEAPVIGPGAGPVRLTCEVTDVAISLKVQDAEVLSAPIPAKHSFAAGNVALRSSGRAYWDDVSITGRVDAAWLVDRLFIALSLLSRDMYEADNSWTTAREMLAGAEAQSRTLHPEGDVDWVAVAAPDGARFVRVVISNERFGIAPVVGFYEADGATVMPGVEPSETKTERSYLVPLEGRVSFYVRIAEGDGRRGTYDLRATIVGQ